MTESKLEAKASESLIKETKQARGEVQTRSDDPDGSPYAGTRQWSSVGEAYEVWCEDASIWKLSWSEGDTRFRFINETLSNLMEWESFPQVLELRSDILKHAANMIFWVNQDVMTSKPKEVLSDLEFRNKYCTLAKLVPEEKQAEPAKKKRRAHRGGKNQQKRKTNRLAALVNAFPKEKCAGSKGLVKLSIVV